MCSLFSFQVPTQIENQKFRDNLANQRRNLSYLVICFPVVGEPTASAGACLGAGEMAFEVGAGADTRPRSPATRKNVGAGDFHGRLLPGVGSGLGRGVVAADQWSCL